MISAFCLRLKNGGTTFNRTMFWVSALMVSIMLALIED
jgi:hypothetical protein